MLREKQQEHERELWKEKLEAELLVAEKKLEMEKTAVSSTTKLPKLKKTSFKGTAGDWIRFENMFLTQVDAKSISDEEKFGYLLESVSPKVRAWNCWLQDSVGSTKERIWANKGRHECAHGRNHQFISTQGVQLFQGARILRETE